MRSTRTRRPTGIAVTGASLRLGAALLARLLERDDVPLLVALDPEPIRADGVEWRQVDVRDPALADRLDGVGTVVHLATTRDPALPTDVRQARNVRGTAAVLDAARTARVRRVVLVTSVEVYGRPRQVPVPERAPVRADADASVTGDHVEMERLAEHGRRTGLDVVVLRPAALVGLGAAEDSPLLRSLVPSRVLAVRGVEPLWQLCHADDLVSALELAAVGAVRGSCAVACAGWLTQSEVEALAGRRRLELPAGVAVSTAERLHRLGITPASPRELDHLLAPLVVEPVRLPAAGWHPTWTNEAALQAYLATAVVAPSRAGAYAAGAAGATVALVGSAALVRRARRRRGR